MRICLFSLTYPPYSYEGIPRQRQVLAHELVALGHQVDVITIGQHSALRLDQGVQVHECAVHAHNYSGQSVDLNTLLSSSQALYEGFQQASRLAPFDIIDVPLWSAQGIVPLLREQATVVWLQTTTAQLLQLHNYSPDYTQQAIIAFEQLCLDLAAGILSDSQSALQAVTEDYHISSNHIVHVAPLGLTDSQRSFQKYPKSQTLEVLVVGRLEQRKGTAILLFEVLPQLLHRYPTLKVRFIGRDNSQHDGWYKKHHEGYAETFRRMHSRLSNQVHFEGYVSEETLEQAYTQADIMLIPSLYESFGLIYLEAMRAKLPIVTFDSGSVSEIFPQGINNGAHVVKLGDTHAFIKAVEQLIQSPELRHTIGDAGYTRFQSHFTARHMANATIEHYQAVIDTCRTPKPHAKVIYQAMEALDFGDAVSNITLDHAKRLQQLRQPPEILSRFTHEQVQAATACLQKAIQVEDAGLIFHYWNYNHSTWLLSALRGPKAIYYHNITPAECFPVNSAAYKQSLAGYKQLKQIIHHFDLIIGDSRYNTLEISPLLDQPKPSLYIYPVAKPFDQVCDQHLLQKLRASNEINIVFIGRIAPNKRQDRLIQLFDYYYRMINRYAHLWLVGNDQGHAEYMNKLIQMKQQSDGADRIHFTGKVSIAEMHAFYQGADVFVCASDHEGFCIPIVEAMSYDIPVLAYHSSAIPETMGDSGIIVQDWDIATIGELIQLMTVDVSLRHRVISSQQKNLQRFTEEKAFERLSAVVQFLRDQSISPLFEQIGSVSGTI